MDDLRPEEIKESVRKKYGDIAEGARAGCGCTASSCCGPSAASYGGSSLQSGYSYADLQTAPVGSDLGLGCGNPQAIAGLQPGETVLDLGSGAGFDSFLAARQVGLSGHVIGVDMTPEMVAKGRELARAETYRNVEFRLGEIENLPVADATVDVIISNCVINLAPDKRTVFREAFRVLKPGGRLAISDVVALAQLPEDVRNDLDLYSNCIAGAVSIPELEAMLRESGFHEIRIRARKEFDQIIGEFARGRHVEDFIASATVEALKPVISLSS